MTKPFLRKIELHLRRKGHPTWMKIVADGTRENLQITFSVQKTMVGTPNESNITIYNLHPQTRQALMQPELQAELYVGWENVRPTLLASGDVVQVVPTKEGTSNQTVLTLFDGYGGISDSGLNKTYRGGLFVQAVVYDLASNLEGVSVDISRIDVNGKLGKSGYTVSGGIAKELNKLANTYGFTWSVQNGVFQAITDGGATKSKHVISADNLFSATAQLQDPSQLSAGQIQVGMTIKAFIQPQIMPGDIVVLKSQFVPMYNGDYTVHNISFSGDSHGPQYDMEIESKKFGA